MLRISWIMRSEVSGEVPEDLADGLSVEKQQEQQLMNKLAAQGRLPARPASSFLQKKLQQRKFFDSGDYAMDKDRIKHTAPLGRPPHPMATSVAPTATCPILNITSIASPDQIVPDGETNLQVLVAFFLRPFFFLYTLSFPQIPRPDTVPQRKASIINPAVHCKLSPMPHVQHHDMQPTQLPSVE
ncbi:cAMP-regulated phosphoprotein/endosulfine region [Dictyocaulus viviparus]|uniref:cAMP-regulated phosphoprotein/endosulfine region n=1 Tax=Dictyocaulus viviparus TaxID=29172 RepID=A0A0D8XRM3_DICVI|nr:cAMP-regulated phosphoprotein/endosulfine region [Dictyocaulus viviparus]